MRLRGPRVSEHPAKAATLQGREGRGQVRVFRVLSFWAQGF